MGTDLNKNPNTEKNPFLQKVNVILKKTFVFIKNITLKIVALGKEYTPLVVAYVKKNLKIVLITVACFVLLIAILVGAHFITTKPFYYSDRLNDGKMITERISLKPFPSESDLQAFIRQYLIGNDNYQIRLPYGSAGRIMGVYHDASKENLVINWNPEFYLAWVEGLPSEDTRLFFYSIKKNFPVKTIRYLIDGRSIPITWEDQRLDLGINLELLTIQKNKK